MKRLGLCNHITSEKSCQEGLCENNYAQHVNIGQEIPPGKWVRTLASQFLPGVSSSHVEILRNKNTWSHRRFPGGKWVLRLKRDGINTTACPRRWCHTALSVFGPSLSFSPCEKDPNHSAYDPLAIFS